MPRERRPLGRALLEERVTLQVDVVVGHEVVYSSWALNEATIEKASRERMLEVVTEVDGRPLSSFGCDGVVVSTPTGSTAQTIRDVVRSAEAQRETPVFVLYNVPDRDCGSYSKGGTQADEYLPWV
ncbi:NAD(+)/NADH kinase, partial [Bacillus sp. S34]|nr:NAD(+)/NADH kinase [Bacillus sp. S34]